MGTRRLPARHRKVADPFALRVGRRVQALRREQDFSFDAFVEATGLGRGYISEFERGLVVPTIATLARVAAALEGVTVADLVCGDTPRDALYTSTRLLGDRQLRELLARARALGAEGPHGK